MLNHVIRGHMTAVCCPTHGVMPPSFVQVCVELPDVYCFFYSALVPSWITIQDVDVFQGDMVVGYP